MCVFVYVCIKLPFGFMATNCEPIYGLSEDEVSTVFAKLYHL